MFSFIRERLSRYKPRTIHCTGPIRAGVLIPLFGNDRSVYIVLTKRTDTVKIHKGEVSFPGGMFEEEDRSLQETALRECHEEIGVRKEDVELIGRLDDMYTLTGVVVTPCVGIIPYPYRFSLSDGEVDRLIFLPLKFLMEVEPVIENATHEGRNAIVPSFHFDGDRIWGATGRMLLSFRNILIDEKV